MEILRNIYYMARRFKVAIRSELMALQAWRAANANPIASIKG